MRRLEIAATNFEWSSETWEAALWAKLEPSVNAFKSQVRALDREAISRGEISGASERRLLNSFADLELLPNEVLGSAEGATPESKAAVGARLQSELLPYMLISENAERWYAKPRGYAGDYLSIARIYEDQPRGLGRVGGILDRCFLNMAAVRAVQNRRRLLVREIQSTIACVAPETACITSLACGPAQELFDVYEELPDPRVLRSTLLDLDLQALAHVADRRDQAKLKQQMLLLNDNLVNLAVGRGRSSIRNQHLVYSVGLIDYFKDELVIRLMNFVHSILADGGRVIFGNFHPRNPTRAIMDHVLDWKLIHRTEDTMNRLFQASAFGRPCTRIVYEEQQVNLFAECVKG
jgi:extracellular factor (EF) 3-hydroxypalmitic acid methyl ester biosynthesis protein